MQHVINNRACHKQNKALTIKRQHSALYKRGEIVDKREEQNTSDLATICKNNGLARGDGENEPKTKSKREK